MAEKKFTGAPFGSQSARFDVSGVHPANKRTGTFTEIPYCKKHNTELERRLGPGTYDVQTGDFSPRAVSERARGPGWKRAQETARLAQTPHLLCKDIWENKRFLKSKVGPGSYRVSDFIELLEKRPGSVRGVCEAREERFRQQRQSYALGPGSYGKGGIPWAALEEKRNQSAGTCPSMDFDSRKERFQQRTVGSDLGPGTYNLKTSTELLLGKSVSKRGPYDLFTGRRDRPVSCGYFAEPKRVDLQPGQYSNPVLTFVDELEKKERRKQGVFSTLAQYPAIPTERFCHSSLSRCPHPVAFPGPGWYDPHPITRAENHRNPPFLSSAPRSSARAERLQNGSHNPVGPGRYDISSHSRTPRTYHSAFGSRTQRYLSNLDRDKHCQERLRPINVPVDRRSSLLPPEKPLGAATLRTAAVA
ncbi:ciliary microtubule-associated protein 2 [Amia ocellicauda]|uniref:ciliary microtubule-associated protein 2 n=1 Tax=Amia ocellicauda TaxID=2972642 RepID=UPI003464E393